MKKAWKAALLATFAVGAIAVSGCGGGSGSSGGGDLPQIGMAIYKFDDTFMSGVRARIEADAKGKAKVDIVDSQNSQPTQNEKIDLFINKKYKAIGVNVVDRPAAGVIIDKAKAANIPLVFMNREPTPEDMKKWDKVYYVGAKAEQSGEMQGKILADYFKKHPEAYKSGDGVLHYVLIKGEPGHQDAELRSKYVIESLKKEGIKVQEIAQDTFAILTTRTDDVKEEGGQHLIGQKRPGDGSGKGREVTPVRAELIGHHQAGHHAHTKVNGKNLRPEMVQRAPDRIFGFQPQPFEYGKIACQADGDRRENNVKGYGKGKLYPCKVKSI